MQVPVPPVPVAMLQWAQLVQTWPAVDLALLKLEFATNATKAQLAGLSSFPFLEVDVSPQRDGTAIYAFGYPLPEHLPPVVKSTMTISHVGLGPRTTSAISSTVDHTKMLTTPADPQVYVLDKALNYGNSGGPIVLTDSGKLFAVCSRFQPLVVPQGTNPPNNVVVLPSLYGIASSLANIGADLAGKLSYAI